MKPLALYPSLSRYQVNVLMGKLFKPFVFVSSSYLDDAITPFVNACSPEGVGGVDAGGGGC